MNKLFIVNLFLFFNITAKAQFGGLINLIDFESTDSLFTIDTSFTGNIWQIGTPSKLFFDSAWSVPNAVLTDTLNFYPPNNFSVFTIKISDTAWGQPQLNRSSISYNHKFDTDSLYDGGYIEISYDGGTSWTNIANDSIADGFYYDWPHSINPTILIVISQVL